MNGEPLPQWVVDETEKISHRAYSTGFYSGHEPGQTVNSGGYIRGWDVAAVCTGEENGMMRLSQRNRFFCGETVSVLEPGEVPYDLTLSEIYNEDMEPIESAPARDDDGLPQDRPKNQRGRVSKSEARAE